MGVKRKHVCVFLLLTVMSRSADSTPLLKVFVCGCFDYVSPRCCGDQWLVNVCLIVDEDRGNQYNKALFMHPVRHPDLSAELFIFLDSFSYVILSGTETVWVSPHTVWTHHCCSSLKANTM